MRESLRVGLDGVFHLRSTFGSEAHRRASRTSNRTSRFNCKRNSVKTASKNSTLMQASQLETGFRFQCLPCIRRRKREGVPRRQCVRSFGGIFDWSRPNVGWCRPVKISQGSGESRHCRNGRPYPPAWLGFRLKFRRNTPPSKRLWFSPRRRPRGRPGMCEDLEASVKACKTNAI